MSWWKPSTWKKTPSKISVTIPQKATIPSKTGTATATQTSSGVKVTGTGSSVGTSIGVTSWRFNFFTPN